MYNTPPGYKSPVLAQARLLSLDSNDFDLITDCGKIQSNPCNHNMSNISTMPSFKARDDQQLRSDLGMSTRQLVELFARKAKSAYERMLISERGKELLSKADEFNIPFDKDSINWLALIDEIEQYEKLIEKANQLGLNWDYHYYDPIGLEQAIEDTEAQCLTEQQLLRGLYINSIRIED